MQEGPQMGTGNMTLSDGKTRKPPSPDVSKIIVCIDVDAFYAQCEELENPNLKTIPVAVTQKFIVVTCNYLARDRGVKKLMAVKEAKSICPELTLVNGEDLNLYRKFSKKMNTVLKRFGTVQRLGLDEAFVDVTEEVTKRSKQLSCLAENDKSISFCGHLYDPRSAKVGLERCSRTMDLRASKTSDDTFTSHNDSLNMPFSPPWHQNLAIGSHVASEIRTCLLAEVGLRASAGIACNKLISKLISGVHKPNDQTILLPEHAADFVAPLPVRAIPGIGSKLQSCLSDLGVYTVLDLRHQSIENLVARFGSRTAGFLAEVMWGIDKSLVLDQGPCKSITVEDSFRHCSNFDMIRGKLQELTPNLVKRIRTDILEEKRYPGKLVVGWRTRGSNYHRSSSSRPFPPITTFDLNESSTCVVAIVDMAMNILQMHLKEPFQINLISIGAAEFSHASIQHQNRNIKEMFGAVTSDRSISTKGFKGFNEVENHGSIAIRENEMQNRFTSEAFNQCCKHSMLSFNETKSDFEENEEDLIPTFWKDLETTKNETRIVLNKEKPSFLIKNRERKITLHLDVDCFYVQVERLDDRSLLTAPLVVEQFNNGGFVAVSYEARKAGIRCGDGVGSGGRAAIPHLRETGAKSVQDCCRICPGLVVRRMRPDRYRQVSEQLFLFLKNRFPSCAVQKSSCDDFFIDLTSQVDAIHNGKETLENMLALPFDISLIPKNSWNETSSSLKIGAHLAKCTREEIRKQFGLTVSCGVSESKLGSRLASPLGKPNGLVVVSDIITSDFLRSAKLESIPGFKSKLGKHIKSQLGISKIADLDRYTECDLIKKFGSKTGSFLSRLAQGTDSSTVVQTRLSQTMMVERSFPPTANAESVQNQLRNIIKLLADRICTSYSRPIKGLRVSWRRGYTDGSSLGKIYSKSKSISSELGTAIQASMSSGSPSHSILNQLQTIAMEVLKKSIEGDISLWGLSRLAVALIFFEGETENPNPDSRANIACLMSHSSHAVCAGKRKSESSSIAKSNEGKQLKRISHHPETFALRKLFEKKGTKEIITELNEDKLSPEERASIKLAISLQYSEACMARDLSRYNSSSTSMGNSSKKMQRIGPMDKFLNSK